MQTGFSLCYTVVRPYINWARLYPATAGFVTSLDNGCNAWNQSPPTTRLDDLPDDVYRELKNIDGIDLSAHPLAEASVAVVLPFTWRDGGRAGHRQGVFKVLKPGVEERLHEELEIWAELGGFLEERCEHHGLPNLDYRETLDSVRRLLRQEVHFEREQKHLAEAADFYAGDNNVVIPRLLPFSSNRVTAMERVDGEKVTDVKLGPRQARKACRSRF